VLAIVDPSAHCALGSICPPARIKRETARL
jgi:hypothetical protein